MKLEWDENKRQINLIKHGLDFAEAAVVLDSRYRLDILLVREGEARMQSFSYVMDRLAVLTLVHVQRANAMRIVSFRTASEQESEKYYEWLQQESDEAGG